MDTICNVCDGTEFTENAGFYYCDNCGARITILQVVEDQADGQFDDVQKKSHKIKAVPKTQNAELTSWETYNCILYGFVSELMQLGCKDELMITTLQLWSAFLRKNEVAFFGKTETVIPKFPFKYKQRDARLIYNLPIKKRRRSSSGASSSELAGNVTVRQSKIALRKKRHSLATTQYEEYMSSQKTDISSVGLNLSQRSSTGQSSDNTDTTIRIRYSRRVRRKVRGKITREHVNEHQNDIGRKLKCHDFKDKESLGRTFVFAMLWLALNQVGDSLQIGDLIRYARESHIKLNNISSFLPPNVDGGQAVHHFRRSATDVLTHASLRAKALTIARVIGIRNVEKPDLEMLCERYCKDLCLPPVLADWLKCLIAFHPPQMKMADTSALFRTVPNYEGRAMAYIVFMLKLLFGLDDKREHMISDAAQAINSKLEETDSKQARLFVWREWREYIEMRNTILSQCHYPTAIQIDPNASIHTTMYVDFLRRNNEESTYQEQYRKYEMENIRMIFEQIVQLHEQHDRLKLKPSCHFQPSLTPFNSYMEQIACDRSIKSQIYIPTFMDVDHEKRDLIAFIKPNKFKTTVRHEIGMRLQIQEIGFNQSLQFQSIRHENTKTTKEVKFQFDVSKTEWIELLKRRDQEQFEKLQTKHNEDNKEIQQTIADHLIRLQAKQNEYESRRKQNRLSSITNEEHEDANSHSMSSSTYFCHPHSKDIVDDIRLLEPRRNLDRQSNMLDYQSSDDDNDNDDDAESNHGDNDDTDADNDDPAPNGTNSIEFIISNFDHWIAMQNIYYMTNASFDDNVQTLPKSFQWLLKQCALHIHQNIKDVYIELLAIESQYRYKLKPIFKMDSYVKYRMDASNKLDVQTINAIRNLQRIW